MANILIIVPAYNEQAVIASTVKKLTEFVKNNDQFDYLVVNDGSSDDTVEVLKASDAKFISHPINLGIGEPFKTGIQYGLDHGFERFINFDADGQHRLDNLKLLTATNGDYIVGSRFVEEKKPKTMRMLGSRILSAAIKIKTGRYIGDPTSGLLLINTKKLAKFYVGRSSNKPEPSLYPKLIGKFDVVEVQVRMNDRENGESYFNVYSSVHFMLEQLFMIILKG